MSLYSMEEVCKDCIHAVFHKCCNKFCECKMNVAEEVNGITNTCNEREYKEE